MVDAASGRRMRLLGSSLSLKGAALREADAAISSTNCSNTSIALAPPADICTAISSFAACFTGALATPIHVLLFTKQTFLVS